MISLLPTHASKIAETTVRGSLLKYLHIAGNPLLVLMQKAEHIVLGKFGPPLEDIQLHREALPRNLAPSRLTS